MNVKLDSSDSSDCDSFKRPKRNCDRPFKTFAEFQRYYIEHGCKKGLGMVVDGKITKVPWKSNFEEWLLAPIDEED